MFSVRFVGSQSDLLHEALLWFAHRREGEAVVHVWAGCGSSRLEELGDRVKGADESSYSADDLHVLHAVLLSLYSETPSEEDFHRKFAYFRENALSLANGLVMATAETGSEAD
jgi:hypothetical protein